MQQRSGILPRFTILPSWLPYFVIASVVIGLAAWFLLPAAVEFPMDDTYIHFVYAENLARTGKLMFNDPGEPGVGTTSLTWVLLLAGAVRLGISVHMAAKVLALMSLIGTGWGLYALFQPLLRPLPALALALLVTASGHMVWFTLSGMETTLFLASGILALLLYRDHRWVWLGAVLGWMALTRPDGLALAAALGIVDIWRNRRITRELRLTGLVCLLVCGPWFGYLIWRTGHILPTSAVGKQTSSLIGIRLVLSRSGSFAFLANFPGLIYIVTWVVYLLEFALGGMSLPGPTIPIGSAVGNANYTVSVVGILGWILVIAPLSVGFIRQQSGFWRSKRYLCEPYRPILVFTAWFFLHNLCYMLFLPIPGTASRYGTVNHVALWLALLLGLLALTQRQEKTTPSWKGLDWRAWLPVGLLLIAAANTLYWNRVYDANLEHMHKVRIAAARYVTQTFSPEQTCAVFDVGAMRYYTQRPILDLGGLIDPELDRYYHENGIDHYLMDHQVECLILPGRTGTTEEGWFDFAKEMGLTTSPLFTMERDAVFEIDHQRWLLGYLPTNNYQDTVTIYRLTPK